MNGPEVAQGLLPVAGKPDRCERLGAVLGDLLRVGGGEVAAYAFDFLRELVPQRLDLAVRGVEHLTFGDPVRRGHQEDDVTGVVAAEGVLLDHSGGGGVGARVLPALLREAVGEL